MAKNIKKQQIDQFNRDFPIGSDVIVTIDGGEQVLMRTTSEAFLHGGYSPVVNLDGMRGFYHIAKVKAAPNV